MFSKTLKRMGKTIGFRLTLWYSAVFIFSSLLLFGLTYVLLSSSIRAQGRELIQTKIREYALQYESGGMKGLMSEIHLEHSNNQLAGFFVRVADPQNKTLSLTLPHKWKEIYVKEIEDGSPSKSGQWTLLRRGDDNVLEIANHRLADGSLLQVGNESEKQEKLLERFQTIFAGIMVPVILLGFTGGFFFAFRALRPIRDLIQAVRSVEGGRMDARVASRQTGDELDELVQLFNGMFERIETLITGMRAALDNAAHDLRTPVARMRAVVETVLHSECDASTLREALMDCAEESERIVTMLSTLMDISEAETGVIDLHLTKTNVISLIEKVIDLYQYVAEEKRVAIRTELPEELYARVDSNRIRQIIANLLDNAIKFSTEGGRIRMEACREGDEVKISIRDSGAGIPPHDLPHIFDRLYRGDKSRSHRGLGLGLSLVQAVVRAHKGRIEVESTPGEGSIFTLFLPVDLRLSPLNG
jgi:signal transduction histidine kinase